MRHPLHPALVHFPVACWSLATMGDVASLFWGEPAWYLSGVLMLGGLVFSVPAMASGFFELVRLPDDSPAVTDANRHMLAVMAALSCYLGSFLLRLQDGTWTAPGLWALATSLFGLLFLGAAGWLGGTLVYGHRLGGTPPST